MHDKTFQELLIEWREIYQENKEEIWESFYSAYESMSIGYRYRRGPYDGQRIVNIYCGNCLLASYNNLKIAITKNKKLENYYCCKCNSNEQIYMETFSYPDGDPTRCWVLHGEDTEVDFLKIDEMYELGLRSLDQKWLKYKK